MEFELPSLDMTEAKAMSAPVNSKRLAFAKFSKKKCLSLDAKEARRQLKLMRDEENFLLEDHYLIENIIGIGSYSRVYLATRKSDNKQFAIKE